MTDSAERQKAITDTLVSALEALMEADPDAFRLRFRKMAADPYAFYRGSASVFYADMADLGDQWADDRTGRVWIQGDLHAGNFGTYMNSEGALAFDVNDFDEAYVGHFSWDLRRFLTSLALLCWQKALPEQSIRELSTTYVRAYLNQVKEYDADGQADFALGLGNTKGTIHAVLQAARAGRRTGLLESLTLVEEHERHFREDHSTRRLDEEEYEQVSESFDDYLKTIPNHDRYQRPVFFRVKDIVGKNGFGIGSAGLPAYNILIEGFDEAQENDIVLSMKQANVAAPSRIVTEGRVRDFFAHDGQRAVISQRSLQTNTDPYLGYTTIAGTAYVVSELSPYQRDLSWEELTEPEQIEPVLENLGRATAKIHCSTDEDSDHDLVSFQTEAAILNVIEGREDEFIDGLVNFCTGYAATVRRDHALFVEAFRENKIAKVPAT
ncbi:DUF2252 domain-containing protein [Arthrobacter sp. H14]|uniref:DUF2252 domain-containing protein n=1 Tax=Arthrobacter sp. H14 TaxID=1312959 RepID=UPI00047A3E78|nr:DUF2252 domain-containing protein [Arthrobacter sp. H14]